jgi:hypothetical protein
MGILPWSKGNAQRKFNDLINEATFKFPNWDPSKTLQIGDFGTLDKKTGELKVEGNIYTHPDIKKIAQDFTADAGTEIDLYQIPSQQVKMLSAPAEAGSAADDQGVAIKSRWKFSTKRGAILLMHKPRMFSVPEGFFNEKTEMPLLKRKVVVEQVYKCPGFFTYLSNKASEEVSVSLRTNIFPATAIPTGSADTTTPTLSVGWKADGCIGVSQQAFREGAEYTPLFRLKSLGRRHWRRDGITPMIEKWEVTYIPWGLLDEDGASEDSDDDGDDDDDDL